MQRRWLMVGAAAILAVAALAGTAAAAQRGSTTTAPKPASAAAWKKLVAQAKAEGKVTLYSVQNPAGLQDMANAFKAKYGISVTVNRNVDSVLQTQVNTEIQTKNPIADIWIPSQRKLVFGAIQNGWVSTPVGPSFFSKKFDRKTWTFGKAWISVIGSCPGRDPRGAGLRRDSWDRSGSLAEDRPASTSPSTAAGRRPVSSSQG